MVYRTTGRKISIHALREEGDKKALFLEKISRISIHALREEGDLLSFVFHHGRNYFYPRPPRGGRQSTLCPGPYLKNFYPRPPRGGRRVIIKTPFQLSEFLSTPSARRATSCLRIRQIEHDHFYPRPPRGGRPADKRDKLLDLWISIHALREEGDKPPARKRATPKKFLSTPSARRATCYARYNRYEISISIHALREEGDDVIQ